MKTLKELHERGNNYLNGYLDALNDFVNLIMDPEVYDRHHSGVLLQYIDSGVLLQYIDDYVTELLEEEINEISTADR